MICQLSNKGRKRSKKQRGLLLFLLWAFLTAHVGWTQDRATIRFSDTGSPVKRECWNPDTQTSELTVSVIAKGGGCTGADYVIYWGDGSSTKVTGNQERVYPKTYNLSSFKSNCAAGLLEHNIIISSTDESCIDINIARLTINKVPRALPTVTAACEDRSSTFTNNSCGRNGSGLSWSWEFSDGRAPLTTQNIAGQRFPDPDQEYWVRLTVNSSVCNTSSTSEPVRFKLKKLPVTNAQIAGIGDGLLCFTDDADSTITLDASGSQEANRYHWNILGGPYEITELVKPDSSVMKVKMLASADYSVSITARNECGNASNTFSTAFQALPLPEISLVPQADGCEEVVYRVLNAQEGAVYTLNDVVFDPSEEKVLKVSEQPYVVRGELSNACGTKRAEDIFYVHTREQVEITTLPEDTTVCMATEPLELRASRPGGDWLGESIVTQADGKVVFLPRSEGEFNVSYTVGTGLCLSSTTHRVAVLNQLAEPAIGIEGLDTRCSPSVVLFSNRSAGHEPGFSLWDFGDGTDEREVQEDTVSHTFRAVGDETFYTVKLTVRNVCGQASASRRVRIIPNTINPLFEVSAEQVCPNEPITLTDATVPLPTHWVWRFGDQQQSNLQSPTHTFTTPGTYQVTLVSTNQCATDSVTRLITVAAPPAPEFSIDSDRLCQGEEVAFSNTTDPKYRFRWDFGDGSQGDTVNFQPWHRYTNEGVYQVRLTIFDGSEVCAASTDAQVKILPVVEPRFSVEVDEAACEPALVKFVNHTENADRWEWEFSDGVNSRKSSVKEPLIPFTSGEYSFQLTASREGACPSDATATRAFDFTDCEVQIPEAFTPNGDLHGDRYTLFGNGIERILFMKIRNRWSEVVYEMEDVPAGSQAQGESWDGTKNGKPLPPDMYVFEAKVRYLDKTESEVIKGNFYLVR